MSLIVPDFNESVIVRSAEAEVIGQAPTTIRLLADSSATGGALSTQRVGLTGGEDADILIVITPGVERFEYFRHLERIAYGKVPPESLLEVQELYDTYFLTSTNWNDARP